MAEKLQFLYVMHAVDPSKAASRDGWTEDDHETFRLHWAHLERLKAADVLVLAGRAHDPDGTGPAFVIIEVPSERDAHAIFETEPFIVRGFATATLHPFQVAISRREV